MQASARNNGLGVGWPKLLSNSLAGALKIGPDMHYNKITPTCEFGDLSVAFE
jgi:hypothetical protein